MNLHLGTMGFGYGDWLDVFYPKSLKASDRLAFYAKHFDAVELDTTFYAVPPIERVERWRDETPEHFQFTVKTPNAISHGRILQRSARSMLEFIGVVRRFDAKLGAILLQFPPSFAINESAALRMFLSDVRQGDPTVRLAIEFRHATWLDRLDETADLLRAFDVALVAAEYECEPRRIKLTSDFLYIRWIGEHQRFPTMDHEQIDVTDRLTGWKHRIEFASSRVKDVFGFFNNDYAGYAIGTCNRFKRMLGIDVREVADPRQGQLFV